MTILDQVIATIRNSKNKSDSKYNLIEAFDFSEAQAEAIVSLQLYRLTNTDVTALENERLQLNEDIASYQAILSDDKVLYGRMKSELKAIKKAYASERRTEIQDEIQEVIVKKQLLIPEEDVVVVVAVVVISNDLVCDHLKLLVLKKSVYATETMYNSSKRCLLWIS